MVYVDTCVLVACYSAEASSGIAQRALQNERALAVTSMTEIEFCSALALKTRTNKADTKIAGEIVALFRGHFASGEFRILEANADICRLASNWIATFKTSLRTMDSFHLAVSHTYEIPILTTDKALAAAAKLLGCDCRLIC